MSFAGLGPVSGILHRALFHLRDAGWDANHDTGMHQKLSAVGLMNEVRQHLFSGGEVRDDAVLHRSDRNDIAWRTAKHILRFLPNGLHRVRHLVDRHDRRLVDDDAASLCVNKGVGRP